MMNQENVCSEKSEGCEGLVYEYLLPDDTPILLCDKHATGLFCLYCGAFIGGTEDVFIFGRWQCSHCYDASDGEDEWDEEDW